MSLELHVECQSALFLEGLTWHIEIESFHTRCHQSSCCAHSSTYVKETYIHQKRPTKETYRLKKSVKHIEWGHLAHINKFMSYLWKNLWTFTYTDTRYICKYSVNIYINIILHTHWCTHLWSECHQSSRGLRSLSTRDCLSLRMIERSCTNPSCSVSKLE